MRGTQHAATETPAICQVVLRLLLDESDALGFVAGHAVQPPREQGHPFGQHELQVSHWREALEHSVSMLLPVFSLLHPRDDRGGGADAVAGGIPTGHFLALFGPRTSDRSYVTSFRRDQHLSDSFPFASPA